MVLGGQSWGRLHEHRQVSGSTVAPDGQLMDQMGHSHTLVLGLKNLGGRQGAGLVRHLQASESQYPLIPQFRGVQSLHSWAWLG